MEVVSMNSSGMNEVRNAIRAHHFAGHKRSFQEGDAIFTLCTCCGKILGGYEDFKSLAFCFNCRKALYPESFDWKKFRKKKHPQVQPWGQFL